MHLEVARPPHSIAYRLDHHADDRDEDQHQRNVKDEKCLLESPTFVEVLQPALLFLVDEEGDGVMADLAFDLFLGFVGVAVKRLPVQNPLLKTHFMHPFDGPSTVAGTDRLSIARQAYSANWSWGCKILNRRAQVYLVNVDDVAGLGEFADVHTLPILGHWWVLL